MEELQQKLEALQSTFEGELLWDESTRLIYATDASAYREKPLAVAFPKNKSDIRTLIDFARPNGTSLIPRTAGTSLAGQVVGSGIVVDVSRHLTRILEVNEKEQWVRVEPGVILDELNLLLKPLGLFFGPETSTANRCMMGGMLGNNACGAHSLVYGSTRDHTLEVTALLSDGSEAVFKALNRDEFNDKCVLDNLEGSLYRQIREMLSDQKNRENILLEYPERSLKRRNTGYAIDLLLDRAPFTEDGPDFNFSTLLAGSEGTLAFTTEIKLNLVPLPPEHKALVCVHHHTVSGSLRANLVTLKYKPVAVELMDRTVLELTKENIEQSHNRFFVEGDPGAILIVEFAEESSQLLEEKLKSLIAELQAADMGYHFPVVRGSDMKKVWDLRKAGLGVLTNMPGDAKPVPVVEDTAVNPEVLPDYIAEFEQMLARYGKDCVYYAHVGTGELHLRPVLNLKDPDDVELFRRIGEECARLVKKYKGSLSGEHGDGRLRGEFIPLMVGQSNYELLQFIKKTWDPDGIFNPGKIIGTPPMHTSLRYRPGTSSREVKTFFDFSKEQGILRATEKCNGTAVCRKTEISGGTMCPSYMATRDERHSTRARANILREFLSNSPKANPFDHKEIYESLDLCLSCKACKSECPSSVDVAKLKAEFLQHYYESNGIPLRTQLIANIAGVNKLGSRFPALYNFVNSNRLLSQITAGLMGFAPQRQFPLLSKITLDKWFTTHQQQSDFPNGTVYLFNDEFTRYTDTDTGIKAIRLLNRLGYRVLFPQHLESGRTFLSKGLVDKAKSIAAKNVELLHGLITEETPLLGIEPSAILSFRDEYPELLRGEAAEKARKLSRNCLMIDEFLAGEMKAGKIKKEQFTSATKHISFHGHCHQKSLASTAPTLFVLSFPENYLVEEIPSGCCGMAGSFGFEKEHYALSMKVGELVLFPAVRKAEAGTVIAAPGTSCRHQIKDGTGRKAQHPVEILFDALA